MTNDDKAYLAELREMDSAYGTEEALANASPVVGDRRFLLALVDKQTESLAKCRAAVADIVRYVPKTWNYEDWISRAQTALAEVLAATQDEETGT